MEETDLHSEKLFSSYLEFRKAPQTLNLSLIHRRQKPLDSTSVYEVTELQ
jgi:hypothetical protein